MRDDSAEILFQSFLQGGPCEQFWHERGCPHFDVIHPAVPLPITALPTLRGALKGRSGEPVVACDMPEPCTFPSLDVSHFSVSCIAKVEGRGWGEGGGCNYLVSVNHSFRKRKASRIVRNV